MVAQEPARDMAIQETPILDMDSRCPPAADSLHLRFCFIALQHWMTSPRVIDRYCGIYWIYWTKGRKAILDDFEVPPNTWLVTLDVESLYTCISHDLGTQAVAYFLDLNSSGIGDTIRFCWIFCCLSWIGTSSPLTVSFIGTLDECQEFVKTLNDNPWNIRLTSHYSQVDTEFLDLKLSVRETKINTTLYRKPTATNSLLHFTSFHPQHLKRGIPRGQFFRVKRNCSQQDDFERCSRELTTRFRERGYPQKISTKAYFNCKSRNLVYALICPCRKVYVGQTTQELRKRIQQHFSNISMAKTDKAKGKTLTSVATHYLDEHNSQLVDTKILGLEGVQTNIRGGNVTLELLRRETRWIFDLNCFNSFWSQ
ncbi:uncharacterized protein [Ranitomeya imitator]|uniref:uncharacterized protein n=1 Tax=Ranitomeya imitator TaxID=111125 RepID=UPI0037E96C09